MKYTFSLMFALFPPLAKIIGMPKIKFAIFVLSNIISFVIGPALVIRIILEGTSQTFFPVAVGPDLNLICRVVCKGLGTATQAGFGGGVIFYKLFLFLSHCQGVIAKKPKAKHAHNIYFFISRLGRKADYLNGD